MTERTEDGPLVVHALTADETGAWPSVEALTVKGGEGVERIAVADLARHAPDLHLMVLDARQTLRARCSCWWRSTPGAGAGVIGHYAAADDANTADDANAADDASASNTANTAKAAKAAKAARAAKADNAADGAARAVIDAACARLAAEGCEQVIAPMDGNTWRSYRFIIERGEEPPFFLEPNHPDAWLRHFVSAGFETLTTYTSALTRDLLRQDARLERAEARLAANGLTIRAWNPADTERELRRIFALSRTSFSGNLYYAPIDEQEFIEQYRRVLPVVRPELVLLAERHDDLVGFLFALPDLHRMPRDASRAIDTIVIKTVAAAPGLAQAGLGSVLVNRVQRDAHALGYRRAIHALMHEDNVSRNISRRYAQTIRRYALLGKRLTPSFSAS